MAKVGRPRIVETAKEFEARALEYFNGQIAAKKPLTITGLVLALGFSHRQSLTDYQKNPAFSDTVKWARLVVENAYEERLQEPKPVGAIFALKQMGWSDRQLLEHSGPNGGPIETHNMSDDEVAKRLADVRNRLAALGSLPAQNGRNGH